VHAWPGRVVGDGSLLTIKKTKISGRRLPAEANEAALARAQMRCGLKQKWRVAFPPEDQVQVAAAGDAASPPGDYRATRRSQTAIVGTAWFML